MEQEAKEKLHIRLNVYDTIMDMYINPEEEEPLRKAAANITDTINKYASLYNSVRSEKQILYMAFIEIALKLQTIAGRNDNQPLLETMNKLSAEIEEALNN